MRMCRVVLMVAVLATSAFGQSIDALSGTVVFLYKLQQRSVIKDGKPVNDNGHPAMETHVDYGTGFFATPDGTTLILVTAEHVASVIGSDFRATLLADNDIPFDVSSEELTGAKTVVWVSHDKEDVAATLLHPTQSVASKLAGHFLTREMLSSDNKAPSRERPVTTLGFPLALGIQEHFSPISRDSLPASGLITLPRFDTHTPATFFLLDNPSIAGFSGAPLFRLPRPYSSSGGLVLPQMSSNSVCVGIVHGTISDESGGKMSAVTPSKYVLETLDKTVLTSKSGH